ncbi:hydroxyethylthiazole kinase [Brachybacterium endophyticum]|uniref:Hydroxyethylthiazole kinase n=1 Tax=Brachybacterium endophyticum TaxID=2182385 RepID=A0A2U2RHH0_9MICO|nr:hydroxyethylthiazole kinase [Brachybacterium endophyticum]PWH05298.1 hydroxyethylthiazole kinase [Brachybacterium endophyticum]
MTDRRHEARIHRAGTDPHTDPDLREATAVIAAVRQREPLVHCITATVSMSIVADGLLAAGARPMMTETLPEAPVLTGIADALLVNFGTLSSDAVESIPVSVRAAGEAGRPWVLDPTAIGRPPVRTAMARELLAEHPRVVRGNASEVLALAGGEGARGADSEDGPESARDAAREVLDLTGGAVAVSGPTDLILDRDSQREVARGDALLTRVTGTGCLLGSLTAACAAAAEHVPEARTNSTGSALAAAHAATVWMSLAGERAARRERRPGSFRWALLDALDEVAEDALAIAAPSGDPATDTEEKR